MSKQIFLKWNAGLVGLLAAVLLLTACGDNSAATASFPTPTTNPNPPTPTPAIGPVAGAKLNFPTDEALHNNITEWWYYTGHLNTTDGQQYGFEYVIFQAVRADFPPGYVSHFAITDLGKQTFKYDQKLNISTKKVAFGGTDGFKLAINDWTMEGLAGTDRLKATMTDGSYGLDMTVKDQKGIVLHGGGLFTYGTAGFSYYYSRPRMSASGTLMVGGQAKQIKDGTVWFDHQWGDFLPLSGGWDWFSLHLSDNTELMVYYLRDDKNNVLDVFGSYVPECKPTCDPASAKPARSIDLRRENITLKPTGQWTSPTSGGVYPAGWTLGIKAGGVPDLELSLKPSVANQELITRQTTGVVYWEGACEVSGSKAGQPITGKSYVELTGYAVNRQ